MAKKAHPKNKSKKSETETEDMPDVETEDMDDGEDDEAPDDEELVEQAKQARDVPGKDAPASEQPSPEQGTGEPANPPAGSPPATTTVTIEGKGSVPVFVGGAMQRLERGKPVKVSEAQLAALKDAGEKIKGK